MTLTIHQPNFFPWYPFFQKIRASDGIVLLGYCQFEKNNFQNRFNVGDRWYTMSIDNNESVCKDRYPSGSKTLIRHKLYKSPDKDWLAIKKSLPQYDYILNQFDECITPSVWATNSSIIRKACKMLGIKQVIHSDYETPLTGSARLADICDMHRADVYLSGPSGEHYMDLNKFKMQTVEYFHAEPHDKIPLLQALSNV